MAATDLENRIKSLEEENKKIKHELDRVKAVTAIQNLLYRDQWYHTCNRNAEIAKLYAKKVPDTRLYWGELGSWEGPDGPAKSGKVFADMEKAPGTMALHLMCNPVIEIAGDGETAKAVWSAVGMVANKDRETGKPTAMWEWNRYGIDFIKEDGEWKIWHHHIYPLFQIGWDESWTERFSKKGDKEGGLQIPPELKMDHGPTPLDVFYSPDTELPFIPPPEPYETFDPKTMY